jgi:nitrate reductase assembly molybdenum cofactor insertion protein NarJ
MAANPAPFVLASALVSYPVDSLPDHIPVLLDDPDVTLPEGMRELILTRLDPGTLADLQSEYISIFDIGAQANPLCETEYDRRRTMGKGAALGDIAGFYRAFGFSLDAEAGGREQLDHVGVQLEFLALMLMKEIHLAESGDAAGVDIVADALAKFLRDHLGRFVSAIGRRPGVSESPFYKAIFDWCASLVDAECHRIGVEPVPADWVESGSDQDGDLGCGQLGGCKKAAEGA